MDPPYDVILAVTSRELTVREPLTIIADAARECPVVLVDTGAAKTVASVDYRTIAEGGEGQEGGDHKGRKDHLGRRRGQRI